MSALSCPAGGWLPPGASFQRKWDDQGIDFATNWNGILQAPGTVKCVQISQDQNFPNGFGPRYGYFEVLDGKWSKLGTPASDNSGVIYLGHDMCLVEVGGIYRLGTALARANEGQNWAGTIGGWVELGPAYWDGSMWLPGPKRDHHWCDALLDTSLVINPPRPILHFGDTGLRVMGTSRLLVQMGYMAAGHYKWTFDQEMHQAVKEFRIKHHLCPKQDQRGVDHGIVDDTTDALMRKVRTDCVTHHRKDWP